MKTYFLPFFAVFLAVGSLAACGGPVQQESAAKPAHPVKSAANYQELLENDVESIKKVCDHGRAIYVHSRYGDPGEMRIVENAEECKNNP